MKSPYVNELKPDQIITSSFLVCSKEIRQKKKGDPYLSLQLGDRTGELDAKMWDNVAEVMETFERDDFVKVKGLIQIFHNRPQLTMHTIHRLDDREVDFTDYFPASTRDPGGDVAGAARIRRGDRAIRTCISWWRRCWTTTDIARRYRVAPAAKQIHHAYLGGLIEHVLSLCHLARLTASHYRDIDADLLVTGVIVHDIGKIYELSYERGFSYSDEGQLLGHMLIARADDRRQAARYPRFSAPAALAGRAHDHQPPRAAGIRIAQRRRCSRKPCCSTIWTIWTPRWNACAT